MGTALDWIQVIAAVMTAAAAVGTLVVAIAAATYAKGQLSEASAAVTEAAKERRAADERHSSQLQHEEQLREEESRPYVTVFTRPLVLRAGCFLELVIKNFGQTAALDLQFEWDKPPRQCFRGSVALVPFPERMPFLAPGQEFATLWDDASKRLDDSELKNETSHTVTVQYRRRRDCDQPFIEHCIVDWTQYQAMNWIQINTVHELTKEIQGLKKSFEKFAKNPVKVYTWDGAEQASVREQEQEKWLQRSRERKERTKTITQNASPNPGDGTDSET